NAESFLDGLLNNNTDRLVTLALSTIGLWIGEIILAFIVVFIGFLGQTIFRFTTRDWVLVVSGIALGLVIPMVVSNWQL
ncbi:MAG: HupE/UreJ family protein, partial [Flavobacteriaceae bacterium]|nr:HupE/UreJ family protein [Flavobacteriaceae bacterium]